MKGCGLLLESPPQLPPGNLHVVSSVNLRTSIARKEDEEEVGRAGREEVASLITADTRAKI